MKRKGNFEKEKRCSFVTMKGVAKNKLGENIKYYQCNISGFYKPKRKGKRRIMSSGKRVDAFISIPTFYKIFMIFVFFLFL